MKRPVMLVTGGSRGIGAATAVMAADRGYDVAIGYLTNIEAEVAGVTSRTGRAAPTSAPRR